MLRSVAARINALVLVALPQLDRGAAGLLFRRLSSAELADGFQMTLPLNFQELQGQSTAYVA